MNAEKRIARVAVICVLGALLMLDSVSAPAAVPGLINMQGKLTDAANNPLADDSYSVTFRIYDNSSGGTILWTQSSSVSTIDGLFTTNLGR